MFYWCGCLLSLLFVSDGCVVVCAVVLLSFDGDFRCCGVLLAACVVWCVVAYDCRCCRCAVSFAAVVCCLLLAVVHCCRVL